MKSAWRRCRGRCQRTAEEHPVAALALETDGFRWSVRWPGSNFYPLCLSQRGWKLTSTLNIILLKWIKCLAVWWWKGFYCINILILLFLMLVIFQSCYQFTKLVVKMDCLYQNQEIFRKVKEERKTEMDNFRLKFSRCWSKKCKNHWKFQGILGSFQECLNILLSYFLLYACKSEIYKWLIKIKILTISVFECCINASMLQKEIF